MNKIRKNKKRYKYIKSGEGNGEGDQYKLRSTSHNTKIKGGRDQVGGGVLIFKGP